ncbi:4'-phosphopantetheinyl transferase family protein [Streptomyces sp. NPDC054932]
MMARIVADWAVAAESREDLDAPLFPEEVAVLARAGKKRRAEFTTVRALARGALARLDVEPGPILPGVKGQPRWPAGVRGSMTHCEGYRAAVVARAADGMAVGIDAEPNAPLSDGALAAITVGAEDRHIGELRSRSPHVQWCRMLFSAKEAVYKTWFPLTGIRIGFRDAQITFEPESGRFSARILRPLPDLPEAGNLSTFNGRWAADEQLIATSICIPEIGR